MLDAKYIKPIPNYIAKKIRDKDKKYKDCNYVRFYAYLAKMKGELVKITVVCKNYKKQWFCKQVAITELLQYDIDGLYYANEMYSNPFGYEKQWIKHLNSIIGFIEELCPQMPLWISPFNSSVYVQSNNSKIKMWDRFFKAVEFRAGDLFLLQDGFGNLPSNPTQKQCQDVYNLDLRIRNCCLANSAADFALNTEYFAKDGYATQQRITLQTEYANKLGNVIACFP